MLRTAFPIDGRQIRAWLEHPDGRVDALSFWAAAELAGACTPVRRVRRRRRG
jgi:hypothetical protein